MSSVMRTKTAAENVMRFPIASSRTVSHLQEKKTLGPELSVVTVSPVMVVMVKSPVTKSSPVTSPVTKLSLVKLFHQ